MVYYLEDTVMAYSSYRVLLSHYQQPGYNPFAYSLQHISKKSKPWLLTYNNNKIIIDKICRHYKNTNQISITHWQANIDINYSGYYPLSSVQCSPCPGCHLNSNRIQNLCTVNVSAIISS